MVQSWRLLFFRIGKVQINRSGQIFDAESKLTSTTRINSHTLITMNNEYDSQSSSKTRSALLILRSPDEVLLLIFSFIPGTARDRVRFQHDGIRRDISHIMVPRSVCLGRAEVHVDLPSNSVAQNGRSRRLFGSTPPTLCNTDGKWRIKPGIKIFKESQFFIGSANFAKQYSISTSAAL